MKPERIQPPTETGAETANDTNAKRGLLNPTRMMTRGLGRRLCRAVQDQPLHVRCLVGAAFGAIEGVLEVLAPETRSKVDDQVLAVVRELSCA